MERRRYPKGKVHDRERERENRHIFASQHHYLDAGEGSLPAHEGHSERASALVAIAELAQGGVEGNMVQP